MRLPELVDAGDAMTKAYDPPEWILQDFFRMGTKGALIAISKGWKTWLMMQLAVCAAVGISFLEYEISVRRKVLFFNTELPEDEFARRLRLMCAGLGVLAKDFRGYFKVLNSSGYNLDFTNIQQVISQVIADGFHPEIIIIDPLFCLYPLHERFDENSNADMLRLLRTFDTIALETGAAVMFSHHFAKFRGDGINVGAGAGAINRSYRSSLIMTEHETDEDCAVIESRGNFQGKKPPFAIRFHDGFFMLAPEVEPTIKGTVLKGKTKEPLLPVNDAAATLVEEITEPKAVDSLIADMEDRFGFRERRARTVIGVLLSEHGFVRSGGGSGRGPSMIGPKT
ncbi:MAG: helicase RepA family protein [Planctomycetota bacterium]|nr:helicase RepA family protein [Planctomycetota bacterium]